MSILRRKNMKNKKIFPETPDNAVESALKPKEEDKTAFELVNQYGTYEIQPTANTENQYPAIAQGFNKNIIQTDRQNKHSAKATFESKQNQKTDKSRLDNK